MELRRVSWVKTMSERWGEGTELDPEGTESQRKVVREFYAPLRAVKTKHPVWRKFWREAKWKPEDQ